MSSSLAVVPLSWSDTCPQDALTDYEKLYCQLQSLGGTRGLPSLRQFRQNDATIQRLLLKRPAQRYGLSLPKASSRGQQVVPAFRRAVNGPVERQTNSADGGKRTLLSGSSLPTSETVSRAMTPVTNTSARDGRAASGSAATSSYGLTSLAGCQSLSPVVLCGHGRYRHQQDTPLSGLAPGALEPANTMGLTRYRGAPQDKLALARYLYRQYQRYLDKMVEIGLGGSTISYVSFEEAFFRGQAQNSDFSARFEQMYRLLKDDKRTKSGAPAQSLPVNLAQTECVTVGQHWLSCVHRHKHHLLRRL